MHDTAILCSPFLAQNLDHTPDSVSTMNQHRKAVTVSYPQLLPEKHTLLIQISVKTVKTNLSYGDPLPGNSIQLFEMFRLNLCSMPWVYTKSREQIAIPPANIRYFVPVVWTDSRDYPLSNAIPASFLQMMIKLI